MFAFHNNFIKPTHCWLTNAFSLFVMTNGHDTTINKLGWLLSSSLCKEGEHSHKWFVINVICRMKRIFCSNWWKTIQEDQGMNLNKVLIRWIFRLMDGVLISIKINIHSQIFCINSHLPGFRSWRLPCNKICMLEMVRICVKYHESDQTNWQDGCKRCAGEGDHCRIGVVMLFFMEEAIRFWWQLSWCGCIVSRFHFILLYENLVCSCTHSNVTWKYYS